MKELRLIASVLATVLVLCFAACSDSPQPSRSNDQTTGVSSGAAPQPTVERPKNLPAERPATAEDWPIYLKDVQRSGSSPDKTLAPPLAVEWTFRTGGKITASPIVVGDVVYVASTDGRLYALPAARWGEKWRFRADGEIVYTPAYVNGIVVLTDSKGNLIAVNGETGDEIWRRTLDGWTSSPPVVAGGFVWVGMHPAEIAAFDPKTGTRVSKTTGTATLDGAKYYTEKGLLNPFQPQTATAPAVDASPTRSLPIRANGYLFLGYGDGTMRVFDSEGAEAWKTRIDGGIEAVPAVARGRLYAPSLDGNLYVLTNAAAVGKPATDGDRIDVIRWKTATHAEPDAASPTGPPLNTGMRLPLESTRNGWAQAVLPNGEARWLEPGSWAKLSESRHNAPFRENRSAAEIVERVDLPQGAEKPVWSPDGRWIAFFGRMQLGARYWQAESIWVYNVETGATRRARVGGFANPHLSWSVDSQWIAYEEYEGEAPVVSFASASNPASKRLVEGLGPSWSPTKHQLALVQPLPKEDDILRINSNGTGATRILTLSVDGYVGDYRPQLPPAWHPAGTHIAIAADARYYEDDVARIVVTGIDPDTELATIRTPAKRFHSAAWSPDGRKIVCVLSGHVGGRVGGRLDRRVTVYWLNEAEPPFSLRHDHAAWIDGERLAYAEYGDMEGEPSRIWVVNLNTRRTTLLLETSAPISGLQWVKERKRLAIWSTSDYLRDGKYEPALTRGWLARVHTNAAF